MRKVHHHPHVIGKETESGKWHASCYITSKWTQDSNSGGFNSRFHALSNFIYSLCPIANKRDTINKY